MTTKNQTTVAAPVNENEVFLEGLDFQTKEARDAAKKIESMQTEMEKLQAIVDAGESAEVEAREAALKLVASLQKAKVGEGAIKAALQAEYGKQARPTKTGEERESHKIEASDKEAIHKFVSASKDGMPITKIWEKFPNLDQVGVTNVVKGLVDSKAIHATGKTRQRLYSAKAA